VVVDKMMRPGQWLGSVLVFPSDCFDTYGWTTGTLKPIPLIPIGCLLEKVE